MKKHFGIDRLVTWKEVRSAIEKRLGRQKKPQLRMKIGSKLLKKPMREPSFYFGNMMQGRG